MLFAIDTRRLKLSPGLPDLLGLIRGSSIEWSGYREVREMSGRPTGLPGSRNRLPGAVPSNPAVEVPDVSASADIRRRRGLRGYPTRSVARTAAPLAAELTLV